MPQNHEPVYYADYLCLDSILNAQHLKSAQAGKPAHDEMLFIVVHQAYELWFKQILFEFDAIIEDFQAPMIDERKIAQCNAKLERVIEIQKVLNEQIRILETMTPLDFLEFRDYLLPASGFQSFQFRLIELKMGLEMSQRTSFDQTPYFQRLSEEHRQVVRDVSRQQSMFELLQDWLERMPFLNATDFDFWKKYGEVVDEMLRDDQSTIMENPTLSQEQKSQQLMEWKSTRAMFDSILDEEKYDKLREKGECRLSHRAVSAALFIQLYRDEPILHMPFQLLNSLVEIDENFSVWRYRHAMMVHRMIGTKIGTGGSSGHQYLKRAADTHRVFSDLFNLSTFLIPRSQLPPLGPQARQLLGFVHQ